MPLPKSRPSPGADTPLVRRLDNGLTVVLTELPQSHGAHLAAYVRAGARFETRELNGVSHFVEHMVFRGTRQYPTLRTLLETFGEAGSEPDADTGVEDTAYHLSAAPEAVPTLLPLLAELVFAPSFPRADVDIERDVLLEEMGECFTPDGRCIDPNELAGSMLYEGTGLALYTIGRPQALQRMKRAHLVAHHRRFYDPRNVILAVAGPMDARALWPHVRRAFAGWKGAGVEVGSDALPLGPTKLRRRRAPVCRFVQQDGDRVQVKLAFPTPGYRGPHEAVMATTADVLGDGFSARVPLRVREERGLAYDVDVRLATLHDAGSIDVDASTDRGSVEELLACTLEVLREFAEEGPSADELRRVRARRRTDFACEADLPSAANGRWGWRRLYGQPRTRAADEALLASVAAEAVAAFARETFRAPRAHLVVVGEVPARRRARLEKLVATALPD